MEMHQLLYVSQAARDIPASDLDDILVAGRANNLARDLSGILIHIDSGFLQILEGQRDAVMQMYGRIAEDQRHSHPRVLVDRTIGARSFPGRGPRGGDHAPDILSAGNGRPSAAGGSKRAPSLL